MKTATMSITVTSNLWVLFFGVLLTVIFLTSAIDNPESPEPVLLGKSGNFALLAKTGISVTGTSSIVGDLGISPAAATFLTGFGLIADPSNEFSTSSLVTGKIYAADYTSPTPTNLTTAIGDMETAYTDAASRPTPDFTELYAGDITGQTLISGIYKWGTAVFVSAGGVTVSGSASNVWIFQIAQNLELADGAIVTLSGGAQASNIFWQVAGQVTLGTTAAMKGIILCQNAIVMNTGATLSGRALAQTAVTLDANAVAEPVSSSTFKNRSLVQRSALIQTWSNQSIEFTVPSNGSAILRILNLHGREVVTLFDGDVQAGNNNHIQFSARDIAKGWYLSNLEYNGRTMPGIMLLVR
ncbi:MAG: DUF3494 domain-containing protein [Chitinispirillaceae bacterium]|nr:DUF3494 domain-containing protein [Chitinispirillaceae bacterium]